MKNIIKSLVIVFAVAAIAGGATYAYFNDSKTISNNTFSAGTLTLDVTSGGSIPFSFTNMKPGDTGDQTFTIANSGTINGALSLTAFNVTNTGGKDSVGNLGDAVLVSFLDSSNNVIVSPMTLNNLAAAISSLPQALDNLNAATSMTYKLHWELPSGTGNEVQGDSAVMNATLNLQQI
ncbi:MAG: TasA family protein [Parcubacteria group bacterium]|jgi:predicted ribosomally synthesized peptide with SipW-like signal peptide